MRPTIVLDVEGPARTLSPETVVDWQAETHRAATTIATSWGDRPVRGGAGSASSGRPVATAADVTSGRSARANTACLLVDEPGDTRSGDQARVDIADGDVPACRAPYSYDRTAPDRVPLRCSTPGRGAMSRRGEDHGPANTARPRARRRAGHGVAPRAPGPRGPVVVGAAARAHRGGRAAGLVVRQIRRQARDDGDQPPRVLPAARRRRGAPHAVFVDYVADTGDGFNATFATARVLS